MFVTKFLSSNIFFLNILLAKIQSVETYQNIFLLLIFIFHFKILNDSPLHKQNLNGLLMQKMIQDIAIFFEECIE